MLPGKHKTWAVLAVILASACGAVLYQATRPPATLPVSVTFLGCTNGPMLYPQRGFDPSFATPARQVMSLPSAIFEVTNHTTSYLAYDLSVRGFKPGATNAESIYGKKGFLAAHTADKTSVYTRGGTNDWRFVVVLSGPIPWPDWQKQTSAVLERLGMKSPFVKKRYQTTNEWTIQ